MKRTFVLAFMIIAAGVCYPQKGEPLKGNRAANFRLEDIEGNTVELSTMIGQGPILITFWATWCKPCLEEMVEYNKIYKEFSQKGFVLLAISTDSERSVAKVKPFVKSRNYSFPILLDINSDVARKYYAQVNPYSVLIDKNGNIIYTHFGYTKGDELIVRAKIEEMVQ